MASKKRKKRDVQDIPVKRSASDMKQCIPADMPYVVGLTTWKVSSNKTTLRAIFREPCPECGAMGEKVCRRFQEGMMVSDLLSPLRQKIEACCAGKFKAKAAAEAAQAVFNPRSTKKKRRANDLAGLRQTVKQRDAEIEALKKALVHEKKGHTKRIKRLDYKSRAVEFDEKNIADWTGMSRVRTCIYQAPHTTHDTHHTHTCAVLFSLFVLVAHPTGAENELYLKARELEDHLKSLCQGSVKLRLASARTPGVWPRAARRPRPRAARSPSRSSRGIGSVHVHPHPTFCSFMSACVIY